MNLKIGIIAVGYRCHEYINSVMAPWINAKFGIPELGIKPIEGVEFYIAATTALFKEYADMGEKYDNDRTETYLAAAKQSKLIDYVDIVKEPILDFQSRNYCWDNLKNLDLDLTWQLDLYDEVYTREQIEKIIEYIKENPYYDYYSVNFKNYAIDINTYLDGFCPPRIHWVKRHGGIDQWVWDNDLRYKDGTLSVNCAKAIIPKGRAFVNHYTWCGDEDFLRKKVRYQNRALKTCSYVFNEQTKKLEFNKEYYTRLGQPIPTLYKD